MTNAKKADSEIKKQLVPVLSRYGFSMVRPRTFGRVSGNVAHGISIQYGRDADSFYLHSYALLIPNPLQDDFSGYRVGWRFHPGGEISGDWIVTAEKPIDVVFQEIASSIEERSIPYFASIPGVCEFVVELVCDVNYRSRVHYFDLAVALACLEKKNKVIQLCEETISSVRGADDYSSEEKAQISGFATDLRSSAIAGKMDSLLLKWREEGMGRLKLKAE